MKKKKIPYGISNFEALQNDNYYFVDKTRYIQTLEEGNEKYIFFLRPRKFGKSLFVSLLQYYYGIEHKDSFDKLFGEYYIGRNPTPKANSYYILPFDFSGIETQNTDSTFNSFKKSVQFSVDSFLRKYKLLDENDHEEVIYQENASDILKALFGKLNSKLNNKKLFILIDEYDHFTNELISFRLTEFKEIVSKNGYVRKFYEVIKTGTGSGIVDRFFATGVTPITLDSLTSGFNIGKDKTTDFRFNEMLGFSDEEVKQMLDYYEVENSIEMMSDLRKLYNGSLFSPEAATRMYNSNMILFFMSEYLPQNMYPRRLIDTNIASDYSKIKNIFYINNSTEHQQKLKEIISSGETAAVITEKFSFERPFNTDDFVSLLFYNGVLTIKEAQFAETIFQIPNYVIKEVYWSFFGMLVEEENDLVFNSDKIRNGMRELAYYNKIENWLLQIEYVLNQLSNRDYQKFDEKYIKLIFITLASLSQLYIIKSEAEVEGEYPDLMFLYRKPFKPNHQFLIELKYLKKSEDKKLSEKMDEAKSQVMRYLEKSEIKFLENLRSYAIVFVGDKSYFEEVEN